MTPCEKKGWEVGHVFKVIESEDLLRGRFQEGSIIVLHRDDGSKLPYFKWVHGVNQGRRDNGIDGNISLEKIKRIYPPEEVKETIELMGKTYDKAEIENALSGVMPIGD